MVLTGDEADCTQLPIVVHSELDAGRYLTAGVMFGRDPETGVLGVGLQRMQLKGPRQFGVNMPAERRVGRAVLKAEDRGERFGVAVVLGAGPFVDLGSQAKIAHAQEKLGVAGALAGRPIELVACKTVDADVPADAEIVIEGHFLPKVREPEGPFGEVAGTYGLLGDRHVFEVSAITMRRDAMYQTALTGMPTTDNHVQAWPAICESIKRMAQLACPEVVDVHAIGPYYIAVVSPSRSAWPTRRATSSSACWGRPRARRRPSTASWSIPTSTCAISTRCCGPLYTRVPADPRRDDLPADGGRAARSLGARAPPFVEDGLRRHGAARRVDASATTGWSSPAPTRCRGERPPR